MKIVNIVNEAEKEATTAPIREKQQNDGDGTHQKLPSLSSCFLFTPLLLWSTFSLIQLFYTIQFDLPSFGQLEREKSKMMIICLCSPSFSFSSSLVSNFSFKFADVRPTDYNVALSQFKLNRLLVLPFSRF